MIAQVFIAIFGVSAVVMSQMIHPTARRWAPIAGLAGQPFWFWAALQAEQWGILALVFLYTGSWWFGAYNQWVVLRRRVPVIHGVSDG